MHRHLKLLLTLPLLWPLQAGALSSDRQQPLEVSADHVVIDQRSGTATYRGNVEIQQGSLFLQADKLELHQANNRLKFMEADGSPARFGQQADNGRVIRGEADHLHYDAATGRITLSGDGQIQHGGDRFSGERIIYDSISGRVEAQGSGEESGRVHAIIQPPAPAEEGGNTGE